MARSLRPRRRRAGSSTRGSRFFEVVVLSFPLLLLIVLGTPLFYPKATSPDEYGDGHMGLVKDLAQEMGYDVATTSISPTAVDQWRPGRTLLVLANPASDYGAGEAAWLKRWVEGGGRLLIVDHGQATSMVTRALGLDVKPTLIFEARLDGGDPGIVRARMHGAAAATTMALRTPGLVFGDEAASSGVAVLATTGNVSFVDVNANGRLDSADTRGPFIVGVASADGRVVLLSGDFLSDAILPEEQNAAAVRALLAMLLPAGGDVVVDTSHATRAPVASPLAATARGVTGGAHAAAWLYLAPGLAVTMAFFAVRRLTSQPAAWLLYDHDPQGVVLGSAETIDASRMLQRLAAVGGDGRSSASADSRRALEGILASRAGPTASPEADR